MSRRHAQNVPGDWYVDTSCINCGASRTIQPGLFVERDDQSVFAKQPATADELMLAWRARLCCPTASVRTQSHVDVPPGVFPEEMTAGIYRLGYNARSSWGAQTSCSPTRTTSPTPDDTRPGSRVWIHEADRTAAPYATDILTGREPAALAPDLLAIPVPGHTKGSVVYLYDGRALFTGDSLAWDFEEDDLAAWEDYAWHSWDEQRASLRRLFDYRFEWVLAGHGASHRLPAEEMHARLEALLQRLG